MKNRVELRYEVALRPVFKHNLTQWEVKIKRFYDDHTTTITTIGYWKYNHQAIAQIVGLQREYAKEHKRCDLVSQFSVIENEIRRR